jgi:hypothetical protein
MCRLRTREFRAGAMIVLALVLSSVVARDEAPGSVSSAGPVRPPVPQEREPLFPDVGAIISQATSPAARIRYGRYVSVQVNVDADGNNILGDAANEPTIVVDPGDPSKLVIGWRQFNSVLSDFRRAGYAYSLDAGNTWHFPGALQPSVFRSDPVLGADGSGRLYYYSLTNSSPMTCQVFRSTDHGVSWTGPDAAYGGDKAWMAVDRTGGIGDGNIYCAWDGSGCCGENWFTRSTDGAQSWMYPVAIPYQPYWGTVNVGPNGAVYVAGGYNGSSVFYCCRSMSAQDSSVTPAFELCRNVNLGGTLLFYTGDGPNPGGLVGQVWVATDNSGGPTHGNVYMLCSLDPPGADPLDVRFSRSTDGGQTWSAPIRINDDAPGTNAWQWFGTLSVAPNGRLDVVWNDTRNSGGDARFSQVYYSYSADGGVTWSPNEPLTPAFNSYLGWPQQNKLGDYYHLISDNLGANLAYAATFNGEQDVYYLHIGPRDCNGNGIADETDIALGTSQDCNLDTVPDECQPGGDQDCNENRVPDLCDIYAGTSPDCDGNGVPDECDLAAGAADCNDNGVLDACDISAGASRDCDDNGVPDECDLAAGEGDCNLNGILDACELLDGTAQDCNGNGVLDVCDIAGGESTDCQPNGIPDDCEATPAHDDCAAAQIVCPGSTYFGSTADATNDGSASCGDSVASADVWYYYQPYGSGFLTISLCDSPYNTVLSVHTACPGTAANEVACNDDYCGLQSRIELFVISGHSYWIRVSGADGATGLFSLTVSGPACAYRPDCNGNGILDDCERDCNGNGVPDDCDITSGFSADVNGNGIPDECDIPGDLNCDGLVNAFDIDPFVLALADQPAYAVAYPDCYAMNGDVNQDGEVNAFDIDPFVLRLTGAAGARGPR